MLAMKAVVPSADNSHGGGPAADFDALHAESPSLPRATSLTPEMVTTTVPSAAHRERAGIAAAVARIAQRVHVCAVIELLAAGQDRLDLQPAQVVRHQQAPVDVVADRVGQIVEHLVRDDQHLAAWTDAEAANVVAGNLADGCRRERLCIDDAQACPPNASATSSLPGTGSKSCARGANGRSMTRLILGPSESSATNVSRRDQSEAMVACLPSGATRIETG